jgi:2-methylcitrate dehydratase
MTQVEKLAAFVQNSSFERLSEQARAQLKVRVLDALGCAIGALDSPPMRAVRALVEELGGSGRCALIGGGSSAPDRAAFLNCGLVRYLDFNDSYLAPGETCHPSDNLGAVLAASEYAGRSGKELLAALAVSYQVQCRLSDEAPVRARGFDHTTQGAYAAAAGVSRALGLDAVQTANAIAISGTAYNALRVTRTGALSNWKGLAYANTAFGAMHAALLARRGISGPAEVFEGNKGFMEAIAGRFSIDWEAEDLERVTRTILKKYNAEIHSQSAIEGLLELKAEAGFEAAAVQQLELDTFDVAYHIIGGGEEGDKRRVGSKEEADHSLPYMLAAALLDGELTPAQYRPERIARGDVQSLLRRVRIRPVPEYSGRFPERMPCRLKVSLRDGRVLVKEKLDYEGFHTRPMSWEAAARKFRSLAEGRAGQREAARIVEAVAGLESIQAAELAAVLQKIR